MKSGFFQTSVSLILLTVLSGCGMISFKESTNSKYRAESTRDRQASFELREKRIKEVEGKEVDCSPKKHDDVLVLLALSGGGSRAALLSGLSMIEMQDIYGSDLLSEVDLISSVSGGSLAAGYYAISGDQNATDECGRAASGRIWSKNTVTKLMSKDYMLPWFGNWFWPDNIALFWLSTYDRTDIMAQTFADNLFDTKLGGKDLRMSNLNPSRPNLVINATQGSANTSRADTKSNSFGQSFTFTTEDFEKICSRIDDYEVARAVMASATFPGVFNFMTLTNHCETNSYVHVFDGGNSDNLGLTSLKRELWYLTDTGKGPGSKRLTDYRSIIVILVDAYTDSSGVSEAANDPRKWHDYIVDTNFIAATDSLLAKNRGNLVNQFETKKIFPYSTNSESSKRGQNSENAEEIQVIQQKQQELAMECKKFFSWESPREAERICRETHWDKTNDQISKKLKYVHVHFGNITDVALRRQLNNIATNFKLRSDRDLDGTGLTAKEAIECAVPLLFGHNNVCGEKKYMASEKAKTEWKAVGDILMQQGSYSM